MTGVAYSSYVRPSSRCATFAPDPDWNFAEGAHPGLARLPADIGRQLKREFGKRWAVDKSKLRLASVDWLAGEVDEFEREKIHVAFDEHEIRIMAQRWSDLCVRMVRLEPMQDFARSVGVEPPEVKKHVTRIGAAARLKCPRWWRRQIRKQFTRRAETHLRARGFVHRRRQLYASDRAVDVRRARQVRNRALLQELVAVSDAGDQLEMWDVVQQSQANPALRRAELMTRLRGFEEVARLAGHVALFFTLTCPSAFHRMHDNGARNERWEGFSVRDGQSWLSRMWARVRAKLKRLSVLFYGFRVAEPHHDGTPHWHAVFFVPPHHEQALRTVIAGAWLSEYVDEPGAQKYRSKCIKIDPVKGSACGYVAKYVAKNIDGFEVGDDYESDGKKAEETCDRVGAWASAHGIRQFQQIGGPPVTVWRELRRLRDVGVSVELGAARAAADAGQWADFIAALGGIEVGRRGIVQLWTERTGELNQYGELRGPQIAGVRAVKSRFERASTVFKSLPIRRYTDEKRGRVYTRRTMSRRKRTWLRLVFDELVRVRTRCKVWRIQRKAAEGSADVAGSRGRAGMILPLRSSLGPVSITVRESISVPSGNVTGAHARGDPWMH